jgi:hypothetical protein
LIASRRPILLLANSGFIIRNLLLGEFADEVIRRRPLVVAVPDPDDRRLAELVQGKPITFVPFPDLARPRGQSRLQKCRSWDTYMYYFKQADKGTRSSELTAKTYYTKQSALGAAGVKALGAAGRTLKQLRLLGLVEDQYLRSVARWSATHRWRELIDFCQPAAAVSTMLTLCPVRSVSCDLPAVAAFREAGIPTGTLVQSWDNLTSKTAVLPDWLERYWTWSDYMTSQFRKLYPRIPPERVRVVGSPQFDFHNRDDLLIPREAYFGRLGLDPQRPVAVIATGTPKSLPDEPQNVVELSRAMRRRLPHCQVLIRLHPKDYGERWAPLRQELSQLGVKLQSTTPAKTDDRGGFIVPKEFYRDQVNCLKHAAVILNTASTITVDAAIVDRPIVCLGFDVRHDSHFPEGRSWSFAHSSHYGPLLESGGIALAPSIEECLSAVATYLENPDWRREGRREIVATVVGSADGLSGKRLAAEVLDVADRPQGGMERQRVSSLQPGWKDHSST